MCAATARTCVSLCVCVCVCPFTCCVGVQGEVELKVPAGSQPGDQLVMRGRGIKKLNSSAFGNQYVNLIVKLPKWVLSLRVLA